MKTTNAIAVLVLSATLAACGGGGGGSVELPTDTVPDSASASVGGMLAWLKKVTGLAQDSAEALDASSFAPPRPDDSEPETL